ncbi:MAG: glycine betaine ABC transporter substrate-binding protein [Spirochaetaceae bacterium]
MTTAKRILVTFLILTVAATFAFASGQQEGAEESKGSVEIAYVEWARAVAITHVAGEILEGMGYEVQLNNVANAAMWQSVAAGDSDALLAAWLPVTHQMFYGEEGEFTDEVVDLGPNYEGARLGLVVPEYVEEDSISDLVENGDKYDWEIVGIDPGAGMMQQTEEAIENDDYGLGEFELLEGSDSTMAAALEDAIRNEEPVVVTGWAPHWKFGRWDLKILEDPDHVFGESETINTVVRQGLEEDDPELFRFFEEFDWFSIEDGLGEVMVEIQEGAEPEEAAAEWLEDNVDAVNEAMPDDMSL